MALLGVDLGSGSCKGVVFDLEGRILGSASLEYAPYYPAPNHVLMNPECFWNAFAEIVRSLAAEHAIEALAVSSHGETIIPVDEHGKAVYHALMNSDNRATAEADLWEPERVYTVTGVPPHAMFGLNKIMCLKKHEPELYQKTACFLAPADYMLERLGLPRCTDYSLGSRVMAMDIGKRQWSDELLEQAGVAKGKLPAPIAAGTLAGRLTAGAARSLGLRDGVAVALGGHDQPCGALGAGVTAHGQVCDSAGTYECLAVTSDTPMNTPEAYKYSLNSYCHVLDGKYVTLAFFSAGVGTRWFVEQFCGEDRIIAENAGQSLHSVLDEAVEKLGGQPTGLCVTPHFLGACNPYWNVNATGVMAGLTPALTRHHVYKALYEGIACELDLNLKALESVAGSLPEIRVSGGNARAKFSVQLRADICGKRFLVQDDTETVCRGAAMLAGTAAGLYSDIGEAVKSLSRPYHAVEPDPARERAYEPQRKRYRILYPALRNFWDR